MFNPAVADPRQCVFSRPIRVRYEWNKTDPQHPVWEQSFSPDGGETWEKNWVAVFSR
ncbi:hypothetical protein AAH979_06480 [Plantactinospora sp. ZYX-F-223]|uniref:hypothetical protein n=1 Tax=Plantactinospora sp. ZYX-F-223 TaxID=3144103 RepID=UPI0031FD4FE3